MSSDPWFPRMLFQVCPFQVPTSSLGNNFLECSPAAFNYFRVTARIFKPLLADALDTEDLTFGRPGVIVEVDESKFGKRKYNRGKHVEGTWVIGGIERTGAGRFFVEAPEQKDPATIYNVLSRRLKDGTIPYSDCCKGYVDVEELPELPHCTVNHSTGFVNPEAGAHTNTTWAKWPH
jgi:hypothetical protein